MNKQLEEAISRVNKDKNKPLKCGDVAILNIEDIEILLKELERLQEENSKLERANKTYINSIQSITPVLLEGYIEKDKIREKIETLNKNKDMISGGYAISILEELLEVR